MSTRSHLGSSLARSAASLALLGLGLGAAVTSAAPAGAQNSYYTGLGYDMSYGQCSVKGVPSDANHPVDFAIIGVGGGRPFTANKCAANQWNYAGSQNQQRSLYFNTGYALAYAKSETPACATLSTQKSFNGTSHEVSAQQTAWAIGCSEADYAIALAPGTPVAWWADVETSNSWSNNLSLNQATIQGIFDELHAKLASPVQVGVYSSPAMWQQIVGTDYVNSGISADWQAGTTCPQANASTKQVDGFSLVATATPAPLWIAQSGTWSAFYTTFDKDSAC